MSDIASRKHLREIIIILSLLLIILITVLATTLELERIPPVWWDEGWTMMVARNWVEHGFYGRYLAGQPAPPGLEGHYPVVASVALSFRFFGTGLWQARLPGVLYTLGAIGLAFYLAFKLYGAGAAWGTLAALLLFIGRPEINPLMIGRQVLGDMPVVFFLLAGYTAFLLSAQVSWVILMLAIFFWGLALATKSQTLPFWLLATLLPLALLAMQKKRKLFWCLASALLGSVLVYRGILALKEIVLRGYTLLPEISQGIFYINAIITDYELRIASIQTVLFFSLAGFIGLAYVMMGVIRNLRHRGLTDPEEMVAFSLWLLAGSWFAWYLLFSNGGARYLAVPAFLASLFAGKMLNELSGSFSLRELLRRSAAMVSIRRSDRNGIGAIFVMILVMFSIPFTLFTYYAFWKSADDSAQRLAHQIHTSTAPDDLIESYDSELLFFLDRPYHYPPDPQHVALLLRYLRGTQEAVLYDPLVADPDYLVIGDTSRNWRLYEPVLVSGVFRLIQEEGRYQLYERIR
jgi:hypothetical protein